MAGIIRLLASEQPLMAVLFMGICSILMGAGTGILGGSLGGKLAVRLGRSPRVLRSTVLTAGTLAGTLSSGLCGAVVGTNLGIGSFTSQLALMGFYGLALGRFVGGLHRQQLAEIDHPVTVRIRLLIWHYFGTELETLLSLLCSVLAGAVFGAVIGLFIPATPLGRAVAAPAQWLVGALIGLVIGAVSAVVGNNYGKVGAMIAGTAVGLAGGIGIGLLIHYLAHFTGTILVGTLISAIGGACFGFIGAERTLENDFR